jgi:hypothetical protein
VNGNTKQNTALPSPWREVRDACRNNFTTNPVNIRDVENSVESVENLCASGVAAVALLLFFALWRHETVLFVPFWGRTAAAGLPNREKYDTISCTYAVYSHTTTGRFP